MYIYIYIYIVKPSSFYVICRLFATFSEVLQLHRWELAPSSFALCCFLHRFFLHWTFFISVLFYFIISRFVDLFRGPPAAWQGARPIFFCILSFLAFSFVCIIFSYLFIHYFQFSFCLLNLIFHFILLLFYFLYVYLFRGPPAAWFSVFCLFIPRSSCRSSISMLEAVFLLLFVFYLFIIPKVIAIGSIYSLFIAFSIYSLFIVHRLVYSFSGRLVYSLFTSVLLQHGGELGPGRRALLVDEVGLTMCIYIYIYIYIHIHIHIIYIYIYTYIHICRPI